MGKKEVLDDIAKQVASCKFCPLYRIAINPVPGNGDAQAELMFIGEAPGYWENQKGIPFCGAAGKLLDELLASIGLDRDKVFVANILKHRPPENRDPLPGEIEACKVYLDEQIKTIEPKAIVTLGRFSMGKFLPYAKITRDHGIGRTIEFNGRKIIVVPMFHPAAALRAENVDRMLREDFKRIPLEIKRLSEVKQTVEEKRENEQLALV